MRVGVILQDENGIYGDVCRDIGQCKYFFLADIDISQKKIAASRIIPCVSQNGKRACLTAEELLKHRITHVITGGVDADVQGTFNQAGVKVFGYTGCVKNAIDRCIHNSLEGKRRRGDSNKKRRS